jgi:ribosomal protein S18 acetylase RimI-like enzyme
LFFLSFFCSGATQVSYRWFAMTVSLRPLRPEDQEFLFQLYASTREEEFSALGWSRPQLEAFLRMQFSAQQRWYETAYPGAEQQIVMRDSTPIGRIIVHSGAVATSLVDISLLPAHRNQGIGGNLLRSLLEECSRARTPLKLQVLKNNPAARLYERLGFVKTGEDEMYFQMAKRFE